MTVIARYRTHFGASVLSAGFRPFFLGAAVWAAVAMPLWLAAYTERIVLPPGLAPWVWHAHEMIFGFAAASVAGFLLTAIPNWTGRLPLQGAPLAVLISLWALGRIGVLISADIGASVTAVADLCFPLAFLAVVAREILVGKNWRNLPVVGALSLLFAGNALVHLDALGLADTAELGIRIGIATLLMLISLVGGRIIPSFTHNWLTKFKPGVGLPASQGRFDLAVLIATGVALGAWAAAPEAMATSWVLAAAGIAMALRLSRWRGLHTAREPLLLILHIGYAWLPFGLLVLAVGGIFENFPSAAALHALTVGAIGTMTLAVMTRAALGHTGHPLAAGPVTTAAYFLVTLAAVLRVLSPFAGEGAEVTLWLAGASWTGAFGLFAIFYGNILVRPRVRGDTSRPI
jgi:uncharacterized protein involved in response to NO